MLNQTRFAIAIIAISVFGLMGCSSNPTTQDFRQDKKVAPEKTVLVSNGSTKERLSKHFQSWRGTPYKYGGLNKRGIDCSGFIYVTYRDVFGQKLPRSTELLADIGKEIPKNQLQIGDLVFFKTGFRKKHVGIYIGKGKFIHASTSKGVMTSTLDSNYWTSHYWKSVTL